MSASPLRSRRTWVSDLTGKRALDSSNRPRRALQEYSRAWAFQTLEPSKSLVDLDQRSFPHFLEEDIKVPLPALRIHFVSAEYLQVNLPDGV